MNGARPAALLFVCVAAMGLGLWVYRSAGPGELESRDSPAPGQARTQPKSGGVWGSLDGPAGALATGDRGIEVRVQGGEDIGAGMVELRCVDAPELRERQPLGPEGIVRSELCPTGLTCLRLEHGSLQQGEPWVVEPGRSVEFGVESQALVDGQVMDRQGTALAGAQLRLSLPGSRELGARTDLDGAFAVLVPALRPCDACDLEAGPHCQGFDSLYAARDPSAARIFVHAPGYAPETFELDRFEGLELVVSPPAPAVSGHVLGAGGQAFTLRTKVLATNMERAGEQHVAFVDEQGRFRLEGLADARYRLRAVRDGLMLAALEEVTPGEEVELRASRDARGSTLRVRVLDARGEPQIAVQIDGGPFRAEFTDEQGWVEARRVLSGDYSLRVSTGRCAAAGLVAKVSPAAGDQVSELEYRLSSDCQLQ